jgi:glycosyltransferase involved in cell wall biosynthesis/SAM-dependent methyltransferase
MDSWVAVKVKKPVAFFSPLPPARTGTADYAQALIPELAQLVDLKVFERIPRGFNPVDFSNIVYQIGNNPWHWEIYQLALRHPGIVVLHEANLHDLIRGNTQGNPGVYLREVVYEIFGVELDALGTAPLNSAGAQPRLFSMLKRLLSVSRACIVHNRYAEGIIRRKGFSGPVARIPHGADAIPRDGAEFRKALGISPEQPLLGMFGYFRPDKQVCECLQAFHRLLQYVPAARLLIAGVPHPEVPVTEEIERLGLTDAVHVLGFQTLGDLDGYIAACDVILNLRWPTFGESSGITARAFGMGKTVVLTDDGVNSDFPDDICVRIPADSYQIPVLSETLEWLLSARAITAEIGGNAARWVAANSTWRHAALRYAEVLAEDRGEVMTNLQAPSLSNREHLAGYLSRWAPPDTAKSRYLHEHMGRLIRTLQLTPGGTPGDRILEMGCYLQITPALRSLLGYGDVRGSYLGTSQSELKTATAENGETFECIIDLFDCERDPFPYPDSYFSTILCCELLEHLKLDPMHMMGEIHRILRDGGVLVLTTPNAVSLRAVHAVVKGNNPAFYNRYPHPLGTDAYSKHEREYTPAEISLLLEACGFLIDHIETGPYSGEQPAGAEWAASLLTSLNAELKLRDDCILAIARKVSAPRDSLPEWLYDSAT